MQIVQDQLNIDTITQKPYLNISEAANYLGVSKRTVERLISTGQIKVVKLLRRVLITKQTLDNL